MEWTHTAAQPPRAEDASELLQPESRVREEPQAELACDGIETIVPERQCLTVSGHRPKRRFVQPLARCFQHRERDVRADHEARSSDDRESHQSGLSRSGGDIKHSIFRRNLGSGEHRWYKKSGPPANVAVIR